ncbi:MAG: hypothetical protein ACUVQI_06750 [Thermochromatium sp.]
MLRVIEGEAGLTTEQVQIQIRIRLPGWVEVRDGLEPGARVVTEGRERIRPGQPTAIHAGLQGTASGTPDRGRTRQSRRRDRPRLSGGPAALRGEAIRLLVRSPRAFSTTATFNTGMVIMVLDRHAKRRSAWVIRPASLETSMCARRAVRR